MKRELCVVWTTLLRNPSRKKNAKHEMCLDVEAKQKRFSGNKVRHVDGEFARMLILIRFKREIKLTNLTMSKESQILYFTFE